MVACLRPCPTRWTSSLKRAQDGGYYITCVRRCLTVEEMLLLQGLPVSYYAERARALEITDRAFAQMVGKTMRERYAAAEKDATKLLETGEVPRDKSLDPTSHAAWTQLSATLLASDLALMMF